MKPSLTRPTPPTSLTARFASIDQLRAGLIQLHFDPPPSRDTLRDWLDRWGIPRIKSNPTAKRGGGTVFYSVAATEKKLREQFTPRR